MYEHDKRIVMTLDAGGTNFVFSAIQGNQEIIEPIHKKSQPQNLDLCLQTIIAGFREVYDVLKEKPAAISFAFPGPADYEHGIIGDLPNFPSFRGGVAMGKMLENEFNLPVFINNDGNLYAFGEALCGFLPEINLKLKGAINSKVYRNLLGITLGTGFGAGVVINDVLLTGDNGCGGDMWLAWNKKYPGMIAEESVSIRAVQRVYNELTGDNDNSLTPKDIFDIAEGAKDGNQAAAQQSFRELGEVLGNSLGQALNIVDGIVVIGGGLIGASKYIIPEAIGELRSSLSTFAGASIPFTESEVYDLTNPTDLEMFLLNETSTISVPFSTEKVEYHHKRKVGIGISHIGTSQAISLGAYAFALSELDK